MANSALIDDLLKQFADNPRRVFARLANEYRKRGELDSAIEICRSHVPLQPGYISGHIVLGQALYDSGSLDEARNSFETALALDPENLIALRHMGDIARANGDVERARGWYRQLLEIDPQNEEVAAQMESLGAPAEPQDSESGSRSEQMGGWGEVSPEAIDLSVEDDVAAESAPAAELEVESSASAGDAELADDALALDEIFELPTNVEEEVTGEASPVATVEGLEATSFQSEESAAEHVEASSLQLVELDEPSPSADDLPERGEVEAEATPGQSSVAPLFPAETYDFTNQDASDDAAASAFATETMAELYLQQGFPDRALAIYRELAARDPDNGSLLERIAELTETEHSAPAPVASAKGSRTAREFFGVLAYRRAPRSTDDDGVQAVAAGTITDPEPAGAEQVAAEASTEVVSSESASGQSTSVASSASSPSPADAHNGKPGREAASALSLDDVFRDTPTAEGSGQRKGLSFDEFFARRGNGTAEQTSGTVAAEADEHAAGEEHPAGDEPQDLELFHAWLDGLKG
ncbi:MAG TPA: tetratricopeptide repeat protein [Gemmatimonadaceae bacterium]|nr:tetratricopeptide repeat protein [Gemmatimonadaceae bacterium]